MGTGRAEGATDFLWMIILSGLVYLGLDIGWAAAILNSVGVFSIVFILSTISLKYSKSSLFTILLMLFVPVSFLSQAAIVGFSTAVYSSLILLFFYLLIYANKASTASIPFLGLLLALVRPDGAIFGVIGSAIFLFSVHSKERLNYIVSLIISGFIGVVYFIQRWNYFDEFLPLPLIVKSTSDSILPGSGMNLMFIDFVYFLLCAALFGIFMLRV